MMNSIKSMTLIFFILIVFHEGIVFATSIDNVKIGRMKVTIMPEYDSPSVLVIEEGRFADKNAFPNKVKFILPKGVTKLTDVCSLSPGGQHFCQLFDVVNGEKANYVDVKLPYPNFFIDYQYTPFKVKKNSKRSFTYHVESMYDAKILEVHVQKPFRSDQFQINPPGEEYEKDNFDFYKYKFKNVKAGDDIKFSISYFKGDIQPSVDIKFSVMSSPGFFKGYTGEIILGLGLTALGAVWIYRKKKKGRVSDAQSI
tara:strand:+ start:19889 stop:20653 length:765 start_codon:yes stop_codon:yes gene_type:complete